MARLRRAGGGGNEANITKKGAALIMTATEQAF